jgi:cellulose biosynthesis protein BcsQ
MSTATSQSSDSPLHELITFYSYKGGTGRSMALANVACLLARRSGEQKRVLVIDWDLEAPGLHYYFKPPAGSAIDSTRQGAVELFSCLIELANGLGSATTEVNEETADRLIADVRYKEFIHPTDIPNVELMPAGCMDKDYEARLRKLDWEGLYRKVPALYRLFARRLADEYAAVLVDSRTGMTDISSVCSALLPDKLVVVFTPNRQSLAGLEQLVRRSTEYRQLSKDLRPLLVYPLPSRIDGERESLRRLWRMGDANASVKGYQPQFEQILKEVYGLSACDLGRYCDEVQIQHSPDCSYGEEIAALDPTRTDRLPDLVRKP